MDLSSLKATESDDGVHVHVRAQPGARKTGVKGLHDGALKIAVTCPANRGRANKALVEYLGGLVGVPPSRVRLIRGNKSREKLFLLEGIGLTQFLSKLNEHI